MTGLRGRSAVFKSSCDDAQTIEKISENYFEKRAFFISSAEMGRALFGFSKLDTGQSWKKTEEKATVKGVEDSIFLIELGGMRT